MGKSDKTYWLHDEKKLQWEIKKKRGSRCFIDNLIRFKKKDSFVFYDFVNFFC